MILRVSDVSKNFGGVKALDNCTLGVKEGEITAIIGPNGSGKTTLFNMISRLIPSDKGNIRLKNIDITNEKDYLIAKSGISRTFQQVRLFHHLTIRDHIEIAFSNYDESLLGGMFCKCEDQTKKIKEILDLVHLEKPLDTFASDLSYGQRKLLDLAVALAKPHSILLLDEPVAGVNPKLRKVIKGIIKKLNKAGETIILIEHDMNFVMDLAKTVFVMESGKVIAKGTPKQIQRNKDVLDAYLGE